MEMVRTRHRGFGGLEAGSQDILRLSIRKHKIEPTRKENFFPDQRVVNGFYFGTTSGPLLTILSPAAEQKRPRRLFSRASPWPR